MNYNSKSKTGIVFLCDVLTAKELRSRIELMLEQSADYSHFYLISCMEYVGSNVLPDDSKIEVYTLGKDKDVFRRNFLEILSNANCSQIIITDGSYVFDTRYSLEKYCLKAQIEDEDVYIINNVLANQSDNLLGNIGNFVFSREWLLKNDIALSGVSQNAKAAFIADIAAVDSNRKIISKISDDELNTRAQFWSKSISCDSFSDAISLCEFLLDISERRNCREMIKIAEILTDNLVNVCGKFISASANKNDKSTKNYEQQLRRFSEYLQRKNYSINVNALAKRMEDALDRPLVSIIVPVYNAEHELQRCLDSIFAQTLKNIEVICVNDGSTDGSLEILKENEKHYENLKVLTQSNSGQGCARNKALMIARGKYIGFVDSDDWIEPCMFEEMAIALEMHPEAQIVKCGVKCDFTYPTAESERKSLESYFTESIPEGVYSIEPGSLLTGSVCDKMYRASLLKDNNIRFPEGVKNEDEAFALFAVCRASNYVLLKGKFYHYIKNMSGTMNTQRRKAASGHIPDTFCVCNLMLDFLIDEGKYSYLGRIIKIILGAADRFEELLEEDTLKHAVSTLLNKAQYQIYIYTVVADKVDWCMRKAAKYVGCCYKEPFVFDDLSLWLPSKSEDVIFADNVTPKISFIVPVYNAGLFLTQTIESLRNQSMREIEILCIDDGSTDKTPEILEYYQKIDSRVHVFTQSNSGVSASRNRGIKEAHGKYLAFVDGDDTLSYNMAQKCYDAAEKFSLQVVAFDYNCFDCMSGEKIDHYWTIANRKADLPIGQVFGAEAFSSSAFSIYGASWMFLWQTSFLLNNTLTFPPIKISEDLCFVAEALSKAERILILPDVLYHYRRNVPGSAITSLGKLSKADPRVETIKEFGRVMLKVSATDLSESAKGNIIGRILNEMRFFSNQSKELKEAAKVEIHNSQDLLKLYFPLILDKQLRVWAENNLRDYDMGAVEGELICQGAANHHLSRRVARLWEQLVTKRKQTDHDAVVVISFLGSKTADPIDSWTFFSWLQSHNIPSFYVTNGNSLFYKDLVAQKKTKNVIALKKSCLRDEHAEYFLKAIFGPLSRAKAVVFEDLVWPWPLRTCFKEADWNLIFLQHGVMWFKLWKNISEFFSRFNLVNVSSESERKLLTEELGSQETLGAPYPKYVIAGLPRWDGLCNERFSKKAPVIFFMFTWRNSFDKLSYNVKGSVYYNSLKALLKSEFIEELHQRGIKTVFAPHHRLIDISPEITEEWGIEMCQQKDISYWVRNADCLVTDYSSISWDFFYQKKPVVFWIPDKLDVSLGAELAQLEFADRKIREVSSLVYDINELQAKLWAYADNGFKPSEDEIKKYAHFFPYRDGFSQRVYENLCCFNEVKGAGD